MAHNSNVKKLPLRILLSNDDGIGALGLKSLEKIAHALSDDVWIVAPESEESGASRKLTLTLPLRMREVSRQKYAVQGTPTDCVLMGVKHLLKDHPPDLVLSGVNRGANIADDVTYSGTIAAAMEGTVLGIPSVALSQTYSFEEGKHARWSCSEHYGAPIVRRLLELGWPKDVLININFPDRAPDKVERVEVTSQGKRDQSMSNIIERVDARGNPYFWLGFSRILSNPAEGTDLRAIYDGRISITPLHLNLTEERARKALALHLDGPASKFD
jgi:5'-nucleotidase